MQARTCTHTHTHISFGFCLSGIFGIFSWKSPWNVLLKQLWTTPNQIRQSSEGTDVFVIVLRRCRHHNHHHHSNTTTSAVFGLTSQFPDLLQKRLMCLAKENVWKLLDQHFYRPDALPVTQQTWVETVKGRVIKRRSRRKYWLAQIGW